MINRNLKNLPKFIFPLLLLYFLVSSLFGLLHNHEEDLTFHDDCPACIWESQSQSDFSEVISYINSILNPVEQIAVFTDCEETHTIQLHTQESQLSRAPPPTA